MSAGFQGFALRDVEVTYPLCDAEVTHTCSTHAGPHAVVAGIQNGANPWTIAGLFEVLSHENKPGPYKTSQRSSWWVSGELTQRKGLSISNTLAKGLKTEGSIILSLLVAHIQYRSSTSSQVFKVSLFSYPWLRSFHVGINTFCFINLNDCVVFNRVPSLIRCLMAGRKVMSRRR